MLIKCYQWRLNRNDCLNRGYVLDNFPKNYDTCRGLFTEQKEAEENQDQEEPEIVLRNKIYPDSIINLSASEQYSKKLMGTFGDDKVKSGHYTFADLSRRYKKWKMNNHADDDRNVQSLLTKGAEGFLQRVEPIVDRCEPGRPEAGPLQIDAGLHRAQRQVHKLPDERGERGDGASAAGGGSGGPQAGARGAAAAGPGCLGGRDAHGPKGGGQTEDGEAAERRQGSFAAEEPPPQVRARAYCRTYFSENLRGILTEGIVELAKAMPEDPISFLSDFLFKNAYRVPEMARGDI